MLLQFQLNRTQKQSPAALVDNKASDLLAQKVLLTLTTAAAAFHFDHYCNYL